MIKRKERKKHNTLLTPITPQHKSNRSQSAISALTSYSNERRKTEINGTQNIFARHALKPGLLERKESIFSHASIDIRVTNDPTTGKEQINQYILTKTLGKGSFAEVFLGYNIIDKQKYAVKVVQLARLRRMMTSKTTTGVDSLESEIAIMKKLKYKHLVKLYEVLGDQENDRVYIITEFMKNGVLKISKAILFTAFLTNFYR